MRAAAVGGFVLVLVLASVGGLAAQTASASGGVPVPELAEALRAAQRQHLQRVAWWGGLNLAAGLTLAATAGGGHPTRRGFGIQTAAWGAINLAIVGAAHLGGFDAPATTLADALRAENGWSDVLLVNLGLNAGYIAVGSALTLAAGRGLRAGDAVRGHAVAVIVQGLGLMALDGVAWMASSQRLDALHAAVAASTTAGAGPVAGSLSFGVRLTPR